MEKEKNFSTNAIDNIRMCVFCGKHVDAKKEAYTEDAEIAHKECLNSFEQHWKDRNEYMDLFGY